MKLKTCLHEGRRLRVVAESDGEVCVLVLFDFAAAPHRRCLRLWWPRERVLMDGYVDKSTKERG